MLNTLVNPSTSAYIRLHYLYTLFIYVFDIIIDNLHVIISYSSVGRATAL